MSLSQQRQLAIAAFYEAILEHLSAFPKLAEHVAEMEKTGVRLRQMQLLLGVEIEDPTAAGGHSDEEFLRSLRIDPDIATPGRAPSTPEGT
jgi:hypothetical protein